MTERQWMRKAHDYTQIRRMHVWLQKRRNARRKLRLWGCACCRRLGDLLSDERSQTTLATAELYADGEVDKADLQNAKVSARVAANKLSRLGGDRPNVRSAVAWSAEATLAHAISAASITAALRASGALELAGVRSRDQEEREQLVLLRDIFGNPFRPVTFDPAWHTDTAVAIASGMYDSRDFSAMPILADALQDAGCENDDILNHCREANGIHVRGCWVVDLVLGKE